MIKFGKNVIKKEFDSEPAYNEKCLKAKTKSYNQKINTNFHNNEIKVLHSLLVYQWFWSILFLERVNIFIPECF